MIGAAPQVLAFIALVAAEGTRLPTGSAADSPNVELSSSYFQAGGALPGTRNTLALVLTAQTNPENAGLAYGGSIGWIRLYQTSDGGLATAHVGNAFVWGGYRVAFPSHLDGELGLGLSLGLTATDPGPRRRLLRAAFDHGLAMQGVYDAWIWAPGRGGFVAPVRLHHQHPLGRWAGSARLEGAFLFTLPANGETDRAMGRVFQAGAEYALLPRPWLAVGSRLHFVWMPRSQLWKSQWSVVPFLAVVRGRWRFAGDLLVNLDGPYGFAGQGQRIWAASLKVGAWL